MPRHHPSLADAPVQRMLRVLLALCLLATVTGAASFAHSLTHDDHGMTGQDCQICYLLAVATAGIVGAIVLLFLQLESSHRRGTFVPSVARDHYRHTSVSPRGPPLR